MVQWLNEAGIDLLEVSGSTYEQLEFFQLQNTSEVRDSTRQREAMFLEYAKSDGAVCHSAEQCYALPSYGSYLTRQYKTTK